MTSTLNALAENRVMTFMWKSVSWIDWKLMMIVIALLVGAGIVNYTSAPPKVPIVKLGAQP